MEGVQVNQLVNSSLDELSSILDELDDLDDVKETLGDSSNQEVEDGIIRAQRNK